MVPPSARVVNLLTSESGHLLLPLDDKFVESPPAPGQKELVLYTSNAVYHVRSSDSPVTASAPVIENALLAEGPGSQESGISADTKGTL